MNFTGLHILNRHALLVTRMLKFYLSTSNTQQACFAGHKDACYAQVLPVSTWNYHMLNKCTAAHNECNDAICK